MAGKVAWKPLESNPEVMTKFVKKLGVPATWQLVDVLGLDPELLQMVPRPVIAVLLLFPLPSEFEDYYKKQTEELAGKEKDVSESAYFMKQTISNACGTIALIHAIANNEGSIQLESDKCLKKFLEATKDLTPDERASTLEKNQEISLAHDESASEGQTSTPNPEEPVNLHFVTLVNVDNTLYEMDGRKPCPVSHGATSEDTFLEDASKVCKDFMARDPKEMHFSVVALAQAHGDH